MIQMVNKWVVDVMFTDGALPIQFIVNEMFYANVLQHVSKMSFEHEVFKISIWLRKDP